MIQNIKLYIQYGAEKLRNSSLEILFNYNLQGEYLNCKSRQRNIWNWNIFPAFKHPQRKGRVPYLRMSVASGKFKALSQFSIILDVDSRIHSPCCNGQPFPLCANNVQGQASNQCNICHWNKAWRITQYKLGSSSLYFPLMNRLALCLTARLVFM